MGVRTKVGSTPDAFGRLRRRIRKRLALRSILGLLLFGFLLVTGPLIAGLLVSGQQIERLSRESEALLERAVGTTQAAREVLERLIAVERASRQYRVLRDLEARANLTRQRDGLREKVVGFRAMDINESLTVLLGTLSAREAVLAEQVVANMEPVEWPFELAAGFRELDGLARELMVQSEETAGRAQNRLASLGARARTTSIIQLALTIPFAVVLAVIFTGLINRPIRRLDGGIRALGRPESGPIPQVNSPRDLRALSVRLESVRRKLVRAERDRQRLLGQVSHELKTPLSAIREGISLLDDQFFGELSSQQVEVIGILQGNIKRLQDQIDGLLRYNRLQAGLTPAEHRAIRVADLVEVALADHSLTMAARKIQTRIKVENALHVAGDPDMLRTALENLISNAVKFSPPGESIGIFAAQRGRNVEIEVADHGTGINPADRHRIFKPFYRGATSAGSVVPGSGLGLAICQDLVRAHGGEVELGERPGWSTVLRVTLPQQPNEERSDEFT